MTSNSENDDDKEFVARLRAEAEQKVQERSDLVQQRRHLDRTIESTRLYVEQLNTFLKVEGLEPVKIVLPKPPRT